MSKHTPGPWAVYYHENTDTYTIHVAGRNWEKWAVAGVGDCTQDEANARLIAAAPDLLEACRAMLTFIERHAPRGLQPEPGSPVALARAAIAKAEGEKT